MTYRHQCGVWQLTRTTIPHHHHRTARRKLDFGKIRLDIKPKLSNALHSPSLFQNITSLHTGGSRKLLKMLTYSLHFVQPPCVYYEMPHKPVFLSTVRSPARWRWHHANPYQTSGGLARRSWTTSSISLKRSLFDRPSRTLNSRISRTRSVTQNTIS